LRTPACAPGGPPLAINVDLRSVTKKPAKVRPGPKWACRMQVIQKPPGGTSPMEVREVPTNAKDGALPEYRKNTVRIHLAHLDGETIGNYR
jgi:hypothetical protein